jgi:hypothetical protein
VTPITSVGGSDSTAVLSDLAALLSAVSLAPSSKPIFVFRPEDTKALALLAGASGGLLFPELGATGGQIAGVPVLPSDQLAAGTALLIDATGVACGSGALTLDSGEHAALQMSDSPATGPTNTVSLLQTDSKALRVERYFVSELARADAVALLENVAWASGS